MSHADRIEVESQNGDPRSLYPIKLDAVILDSGPGLTLELGLREILRGSDFLEPVLAALGQPALVRGLADARTVVLDPTGKAIVLDSVLPGTACRLRLPISSGEPFPLLWISLRGEDAVSE